MYVRIEIRVRFDGSFNVGSGAAEDTWADKPLAKDYRGLPMIPASSLKGRLRHTCERLARTLHEKGLLDQEPCHSPQPEAMCQPDDTRDLCPICRLFGSPWVHSPLYFSDLQLVEPEFLLETDPPPQIQMRYGVGISRHRRVAEEQILYTTEVFQPGGELVLAGPTEGDIDENDLALLLAGLDLLFTLGGGKTRGLGWCQVDVGIFDADDQRIDSEEIRGRWLDGAD